MIKELRVPLIDLVMCLSDAIDLISPVLANHHKQVSYIAFSIAREMKLPSDEQTSLALAGALHDIGGLSRQERLDAINEAGNIHNHSQTGYTLLKGFAPFSGLAPIVRDHHISWNEGHGSERDGEEIPATCSILCVADRIAALVRKDREILGQVRQICESIVKRSGKVFNPDVVDAFLQLAKREYFWMDMVSPLTIGNTLSRTLSVSTALLDLDGLNNLAQFFAHIIDFRSPFTATHSLGVAVSAELLAKLAGFSKRECVMMRVAGFLHDLGKLAVPAEVLEKPAKLTNEEFNIIRSHTFHGYRILERLDDLDTINMWASFHHERLDGTGYPFHHSIENLPIGSRIMAVADVFTAVTEDRPYRKGMNHNEALDIVRDMAEQSWLDSNIVSLLKSHFDEIASARINTQKAGSIAYEEFRADAGR